MMMRELCHKGAELMMAYGEQGLDKPEKAKRALAFADHVCDCGDCDGMEAGPPKKGVESDLVGYARRSIAGGAIKINICATAFEKARRYMSQDGNEYVGLVVSLDKLKSVIDGERTVVSICQLVNKET